MVEGGGRVEVGTAPRKHVRQEELNCDQPSVPEHPVGIRNAVIWVKAEERNEKAALAERKRYLTR